MSRSSKRSCDDDTADPADSVAVAPYVRHHPSMCTCLYDDDQFQPGLFCPFHTVVDIDCRGRL